MAASMLTRFQGSLVGGVVGDCIGANLEGHWGIYAGTKAVITLINKIEKDTKKSNRELQKFTDDTAMARSVVKSLIHHNGLDVTDMAKRFTREFFKEWDRGYGGNVGTVFHLLRDGKHEDVYGPAKRQFDGSGSYGNGGAMRISPAGLFAFKKQLAIKELQSMTEQITWITHSHSHAVTGAILQSYAVHLAMSIQKLDVDEFVDHLLDVIRPIEELDAPELPAGEDETVATSGADKTNSGEPQERMPYCKKLEKLRAYVKQDSQASYGDIDDYLGTDVSALGSVPTAIYCFLRATKPIEDFEERNPFERTIMYAISLGGDTDTIATMAGSIAGAYYGLDMIPSSWQQCSEGADEALKDAELLYNL